MIETTTKKHVSAIIIKYKGYYQKNSENGAQDVFYANAMALVEGPVWLDICSDPDMVRLSRPPYGRRTGWIRNRRRRDRTPNAIKAVHVLEGDAMLGFWGPSSRGRDDHRVGKVAAGDGLVNRGW